jgi:ubiquinone/menaquinone biosynthesis C-methylase UbiE
MDDAFEPYARFYDLDYAGMDADLPVIQQFAMRCGSPILELACGTGRVLLPLAHQGYRVTGVDVSPSMLNRARGKVALEGLEDRVTLMQQDMRDLSLDGLFSLALVVSNSFLHLMTIDDQLAALKGVRRHLDPGGLLLLDVFNPDLSRLLDFQGRITLEKVMLDPETGHRLMKYHSQMADLGQQTIQVTYVVDEMDAEGRLLQRTLFPFCLRYLFRYELELLLRHAGFELEAIYGSYELDDFTGDSQRMVAIARQPG